MYVLESSDGGKCAIFTLMACYRLQDGFEEASVEQTADGKYHGRSVLHSGSIWLYDLHNQVSGDAIPEVSCGGKHHSRYSFSYHKPFRSFVELNLMFGKTCSLQCRVYFKKFQFQAK